MMDTEHLKNNLALTRTENYFLAWMKNFYDVSSLYGLSFVELKRVFADFSSAARYEKYGGVPSLLSIAEKNGIVSHRRFPAPYVALFGGYGVGVYSRAGRERLVLGARQ